MNPDQKKQIWKTIERYKPNLADEIGWGSMDSLCVEVEDLITQAHKAGMVEVLEKTLQFAYDPELGRAHFIPYLEQSIMKLALKDTTGEDK